MLQQLEPSKTLIILDSARAHITHRVLQAFQQRRFRVAVIPGGCTQYLQSVDIFYAAAVKRLIFERYTQCHG